MGHYYSELNGEPFTKKETITDFATAAQVLKYKDLDYQNIREVYREWIPDEPTRGWIHIAYNSPAFGRCYTIATMKEWQEAQIWYANKN